jgi:hypothetical protein
MHIKGPMGNAYVYQGEGHDWVMEFWPNWTRKHPRKPSKQVFPNSAKQAAITRAKQVTGFYDAAKKATKKRRP